MEKNNNLAAETSILEEYKQKLNHRDRKINKLNEIIAENRKEIARLTSQVEENSKNSHGAQIIGGKHQRTVFRKDFPIINTAGEQMIEGEVEDVIQHGEGDIEHYTKSEKQGRDKKSNQNLRGKVIINNNFDLDQKTTSNDVDTIYVQELVKSLESLCKKLYLHIDIEYCKKIEIPDNLKYMFTPVHTTIEGYKDANGDTCTYIGDTVDNSPHGYGKCVYEDRTEEGTYMNGLRHGSIKCIYNDDEEGMISADIQCMYGKLHGNAEIKHRDRIAYEVYSNDSIVHVSKQVFIDSERNYNHYFNEDLSSDDFCKLRYFRDDTLIYVWKREGDDSFNIFRRE